MIFEARSTSLHTYLLHRRRKKIYTQKKTNKEKLSLTAIQLSRNVNKNIVYPNSILERAMPRPRSSINKHLYMEQPLNINLSCSNVILYTIYACLQHFVPS